MIPRTKFGDCSNPDCNETNTNCVKVGRNLYCLKCRKKQKAKDQITKQSRQAISRKLYKTQTESGNTPIAERTFLIQDLDASYSKYVRKKEATPQGTTTCFTCGAMDSWTKMDCGHFISRSNMYLRWDLRNLRPQCKNCNQYKSGNLDKFAENLELEMPGIVSSLMEDSKIVQKWTKDELKQMLIDIYAKIKITDIKFNTK